LPNHRRRSLSPPQNPAGGGQRRIVYIDPGGSSPGSAWSLHAGVIFNASMPFSQKWDPAKLRRQAAVPSEGRVSWEDMTNLTAYQTPES
jgi:hypothetical protein